MTNRFTIKSVVKPNKFYMMDDTEDSITENVLVKHLFWYKLALANYQNLCQNDITFQEFVMGRTKDLFNEIVDMFNNGYDAEDIAVVLNVPIDEVESILDNLNNPSANNVPY